MYRNEDIADLAGRLEDAAKTLHEMRLKTNSLSTHSRLSAKRQGVMLALDYLRAYEVK